MKNIVNHFAWQKVHVLLWLMFNFVLLTHCQSARLLTSYLPASMQALAYYIDQLQYEPLSITTVEPPFDVNVSSSTMETTKPTIQKTTKITRTTSTTRKPLGSNNGLWQSPSWWQQKTTTTMIPKTTKSTAAFTTRNPHTNCWWKPPSWWPNRITDLPQTTTKTPTENFPTPPHPPGIFSPIQPFYLQHQSIKHQKRLPEGYEIFCQLEAKNSETLTELPLALIRDICSESEHDQFTNDVESLDKFLHLYDDNYGRDTISNVDSVLDRWSTAGKKRVPPNKPYIEFLLVYDLLKRDAKADNLNKYEGYSEGMLQQLHTLSDVSAPHQLNTLFTRMLERRDIQLGDVVSRIQSLIKELGIPQSATAKALQLVPTIQFLT